MRKIHRNLWAELSSVLVAGGVAGSAGLSGCVVESSDCATTRCDCGDDGWWTNGGAGGEPGAPSEAIFTAMIDTGQTLETDFGKGIGFFVEYLGQGRWHCFTSCDTDLSGRACQFAVVASADGGLAVAAGAQSASEVLEGRDLVSQANGRVEMLVETGSDADGIWLDGLAGVTVRFDMQIDGSRDPRLMYWIGGGAIHNGAPSDPIDLRPSEP